MADSVVSLGIDLSPFETVLKQGLDGLGKGAQRAIAQAKAAAAQAAREATSAFKIQLQLQQQAARDQAAAARDQLRAEKDLQREAQRTAAEKARAASALATLAAGRTETEALTHAFQEQIKEIARLVELTGDQEAGAKAAAAAAAKHEAAMRRLTDATVDSASGTERAAGASYALRQQAQSLQKNLMDVVQSLIAGQSPMTVLSQQGPQLAEAFAQAGDSAGLLKSAFGGVAGAVAPLASALAGAAVAGAALGTAYAVVANHTEQLQTGLINLRAQVDASRRAIASAAEAAAANAEALRGMQAAAKTAQDDLRVLVGTTSRHEVELRRQIAAIEDSTKAQVLDNARRLTAAQLALEHERALYANRDASITERAEASKRIKQLEKTIAVEKAALASAKQAVAQQKEAAALTAEYNTELEEAERRIEQREEAESAARDAAQRRADAERDAADAAKKLADEEAKAAAAAREWAREQGMVAAAAQELGRLGPEIESLIATLEGATAAQLTREIQAAEVAVAEVTRTIRDGFREELRGAYAEVRGLGTELAQFGGVDLGGGAVSALLDVAKQAVEAEREALSSVADARAELRAAMASGDAGAIAEAREGLRAARSELEAARPAAFVQELVKGAADMVKGIVDALPAVVRGLTAAAPRLITSLVDGIPKLVQGLARAAPEIAINLASALAIELPIQLIAQAPKIVRALALSIGEGFVAAAKRIRRVIGDIFREIATAGRADTRTFGDTPGPVRVGPRGARVSPGDVVVAARTRQGLEAQLGARSSASSPTAVQVVLDVRDGPVRLGLATAAQRQPVDLSFARQRSPWGS
jgi:hypothetical protein